LSVRDIAMMLELLGSL